MTAFNQAQDPYTAALELLVLELAGALIHAKVVDGPAFAARLGLYVEALEQSSNPKAQQGALEMNSLRAKLREIQPLTAAS